MDWLVDDISNLLRSSGQAGGKVRGVIVKSDGEPAMVAVRNAVMKYHGDNDPGIPREG